MNGRRLFYCVAIVSVVVGQVLGVHAQEPQGTRPEAAISKQGWKKIAEFRKLWYGGKREECKRFFGKDAIGEGKTSLAEALRKIEDQPGTEMHYSTERLEKNEGKLVAVRHTRWKLRPLEEVREEPALYAVEERFTILFKGDELYIDEYEFEDITEDELKQSQEWLAKQNKILSNQSVSAPRRLGVGVRIYMQYWCDYDYKKMWPLLKRLTDMGIRDKTPMHFRVLKDFTVRTLKDGLPPKEYRSLVQDVVGDKWPKTEPAKSAQDGKQE